MRQLQAAATHQQLPAMQPAGERCEQALSGENQRFGMLDTGGQFNVDGEIFGKDKDICGSGRSPQARNKSSTGPLPTRRRKPAPGMASRSPSRFRPKDSSRFSTSFGQPGRAQGSLAKADCMPAMSG
jgi:hypothetical protein